MRRLGAAQRATRLLARSSASEVAIAAQQPPAGRARETLDDVRQRSWASGDLDSEVGEQIAGFFSIRSRSGH